LLTGQLLKKEQDLPDPTIGREAAERLVERRDTETVTEREQQGV
jgi:hypothetical protein